MLVSDIETPKLSEVSEIGKDTPGQQYHRRRGVRNLVARVEFSVLSSAVHSRLPRRGVHYHRIAKLLVRDLCAFDTGPLSPAAYWTDSAAHAKPR